MYSLLCNILVQWFNENTETCLTHKAKPRKPVQQTQPVSSKNRRHYWISCLPTRSWKRLFARHKWKGTTTGHMPAGESCSSPPTHHVCCVRFSLLDDYLSDNIQVLKIGQVSRHCCVSVTGNIPQRICFPFSAAPSRRYATGAFSEIPAQIEICLNETLWRQLNRMHLCIP